ncbi:MAG: SDR family oxidoreductase [archaeon]
MVKTLSGKTSVITGAGKGIGRQIAKHLASQGSNLVIIARTRADLDSLESELSGVEVLKCQADVSDSESIKKCFSQAAEKFGKIDILVNNAGMYGPIGPLEQNDLKLWQKTIEVNLLGMVNCIKAVLPHMPSGKIINLAGGGVGGNLKPNLSAYTTSKFAVAGLTQCLSIELKNIDINCIAPGAINTQLLEQILEAGEKAGKDFLEQSKKQKEFGGDSVEKVAELVSFLASEKSNGITGRLISAKWDNWENLSKSDFENNSLYRLRRIDNFLAFEKKGDENG